jgi:hypothetical protein
VVVYKHISISFLKRESGSVVKQQLVFNDEDYHISLVQIDSCQNQIERVALVRKWKTTPEQLSEFIERWTAFRKEFLFDKVLLVIDSDKDESMTYDCLQALEQAGTLPDWLCPVWIAGCGDGRNWVQMLSAGIYALTRMNPARNCEVLCSSFDAVARPGFGQAYIDCDHEMPVPMLGIRCTLPESHTKEMAEFVASDSPLLDMLDLMKKFQRFFEGAGDFEPTHVPVLKQMCRNTMQLWRLDALIQIGGFDLRCNEWGGQEDLMAFLMIMLQVDFEELPVAFFHYDDSTVSSKKQTYLRETQDEKGQREDEAVVKILTELREMSQAVTTTLELRVPSPMFGLLD